MYICLVFGDSLIHTYVWSATHTAHHELSIYFAMRNVERVYRAERSDISAIQEAAFQANIHASKNRLDLAGNHSRICVVEADNIKEELDAINNTLDILDEELDQCNYQINHHQKWLQQNRDQPMKSVFAARLLHNLLTLKSEINADLIEMCRQSIDALARGSAAEERCILATKRENMALIDFLSNTRTVESQLEQKNAELIIQYNRIIEALRDLLNAG